jgi:prostamide/prostaglandin F2alpha synthase
VAGVLKRLLGTAGTKQEARPPQDSSGLADLVVKDLDGNDVRVASFWADGPAVLVWLRHYG